MNVRSLSLLMAGVILAVGSISAADTRIGLDDAIALGDRWRHELYGNFDRELGAARPGAINQSKGLLDPPVPRAVLSPTGGDTLVYQPVGST